MTTTVEVETPAATTHPWEQRFNELADYVAEHNTYPTAASLTVLGRWVSTQRANYRDGKISVERIAKLETLPGWAWNAHDAAWAEQLARVADHVAHHHAYPNTHNTELGVWLEAQRSYERAGTLSLARATRLETLPGWSWEPFRTNWNLMFMQLAEHFKGTDQSPPRGGALAHWVTSQRRAYHDGDLSAECVGLLEGLPQWRWTHVPTPRNANGKFTRPVAC